MAVQFNVAYSSTLKGAGIIAGGPYYCAQGDKITAISKCSCTGLLCRVKPGSTDVQKLIKITNQYASNGTIDPTINLAHQKIWLFSGTADSLIPQSVMDELDVFYQHFTESADIHYQKNIIAQHTMPTDFFGSSCETLASPYINNCRFDAAGEMLKWIYGNLNPKQESTLQGEFIEFDQSEFSPRPTADGLAKTGFLYVPVTCSKMSNEPCKLHVVFHGCLQDSKNIGEIFIKNAGYNQWADANNMIMLYPQAAATLPNNPNACWNWFNFNHDDPNYANKNGRQMIAIKKMIDRITALKGE
ncbi:MAG: PHA-depolymerase-like protein [Tatlockia sp.]|nr:PHA-depolymerase-like protein [Tatlockia sp.]